MNVTYTVNDLLDTFDDVDIKTASKALLMQRIDMQIRIFNLIPEECIKPVDYKYIVEVDNFKMIVPALETKTVSATVIIDDWEIDYIKETFDSRMLTLKKKGTPVMFCTKRKVYFDYRDIGI